MLLLISHSVGCSPMLLIRRSGISPSGIGHMGVFSHFLVYSCRSSTSSSSACVELPSEIRSAPCGCLPLPFQGSCHLFCYFPRKRCRMGGPMFSNVLVRSLVWPHAAVPSSCLHSASISVSPTDHRVGQWCTEPTCQVTLNCLAYVECLGPSVSP